MVDNGKDDRQNHLRLATHTTVQSQHTVAIGWELERWACSSIRSPQTSLLPVPPAVLLAFPHNDRTHCNGALAFLMSSLRWTRSKTELNAHLSVSCPFHQCCFPPQHVSAHVPHMYDSEDQEASEKSPWLLLSHRSPAGWCPGKCARRRSHWTHRTLCRKLGWSIYNIISYHYDVTMYDKWWWRRDIDKDDSDTKGTVDINQCDYDSD